MRCLSSRRMITKQHGRTDRTVTRCKCFVTLCDMGVTWPDKAGIAGYSSAATWRGCPSPHDFLSSHSLISVVNAVGDAATRRTPRSTTTATLATPWATRIPSQSDVGSILHSQARRCLEAPFESPAISTLPPACYRFPLTITLLYLSDLRATDISAVYQLRTLTSVTTLPPPRRVAMLAVHPPQTDRTRPPPHPAYTLTTRGRSRDVSPIALGRATSDQHGFHAQISLNLTLSSNLDAPPQSIVRVPELSTTPRQIPREKYIDNEQPIASSSRLTSSPPFG